MKITILTKTAVNQFASRVIAQLPYVSQIQALPLASKSAPAAQQSSLTKLRLTVFLSEGHQNRRNSYDRVSSASQQGRRVRVRLAVRSKSITCPDAVEEFVDLVPVALAYGYDGVSIETNGVKGGFAYILYSSIVMGMKVIGETTLSCRKVDKVDN